MIKHIVMFRFSDENKKEIILPELKKKIENLKDKIAVLRHIEAGINFSTRDVAFDIALVSEFENEDDLEQYRIHPDHVALIDFLKQYEYEVAVCDYKGMMG